MNSSISKNISTLTLEWSKDIHGYKNQFSNSNYDTCDRLAVLLYKSILFRFITFNIYQFNSLNKSVYNEQPQFFINLINESLLEEVKDLKIVTPKDTLNYTFKFNYPKYEIIENKFKLLRLINVLLSVSKEKLEISEYENLIDYFDYGMATGFLKEYLRFYLVYTNNLNSDTDVYTSMPFNLPVCSRRGYGIDFDFIDKSVTSISYVNCNNPDPISFISNCSIQNSNSDSYFRFLGKLYFDEEFDKNSIYKFYHYKFIVNKGLTLKSELLKKYCETNTDFTDLEYCVINFLNVLKTIHINHSCPIGQLTNKLLHEISTLELGTYELEIVNLFINKQDVEYVQLCDKSNEDYNKYLDINSILFIEPNNVWVNR